jgi:hypothetical protein
LIGRCFVAAIALLLVPAAAMAQTAPAAQAPSRANAWSVFASAYTYIIPENSNYAQPTFTADRRRLHLEARYNYEARNTGSVWVGWNFSGGDTIEWELTPMVGGVVGDLDGIAPGYKGSLTWRRISVYSEGEYVIDTASTSDSFLYNWSEWTYAFTDALRAGLVVQRTRTFQTDRQVQRGLIVGYTWRRAEFTLCLFNPDEDKPSSAFSVGFRF